MPLVVEKTLQHMKHLAEKGPSDAELAQARKQVTAHTHMLWESPSTRMRLIGEYYTHTKKVINAQEELERLCSVTRENLQENMQNLLAGKPTCTVLADSPVMPTDAQLKEWNVRF